jgi:hypothetical protein
MICENQVFNSGDNAVLDNLSAYIADDSLRREVAAALSGQEP